MLQRAYWTYASLCARGISALAVVATSSGVRVRQKFAAEGKRRGGYALMLGANRATFAFPWPTFPQWPRRRTLR